MPNHIKPMPQNLECKEEISGQINILTIARKLQTTSIRGTSSYEETLFVIKYDNLFNLLQTYKLK